MPWTARPIIDRLNEYHYIDEETGCWIWLGKLDNNGYGHIQMGSRTDGTRRDTVAHVVSYQTFVGEIPKGLELDHICRTRNCINPEHLEPVTHLENVQRGWRSRTEQNQ